MSSSSSSSSEDEKCSDDEKCTYLIKIRTDDIRFAGTDDDVYMRLFDLSGASTDEFLLDNPGKNDFERNQEDQFEISAKYLEKISKIEIHKKKRSLALKSDDWNFDGVGINRNEEEIFVCRKYGMLVKDEKVELFNQLTEIKKWNEKITNQFF